MSTTTTTTTTAKGVVWCFYLATVTCVVLGFHSPFLYHAAYYPILTSHYHRPPPSSLYPPMLSLWTHKTLQRASQGRKSKPLGKRTYDTLHTSGTSSNPLRYVPIVKKVTHHHVHHIVTEGSSSTEDSLLNMARLGRFLIKSLYSLKNHHHQINEVNGSKLRKSGASLSLMVNSSNRIPYKDDEEEEERGKVRQSHKPNQDTMYEDEVNTVKQLHGNADQQMDLDEQNDVSHSSFRPGVIPFEQLIRLTQQKRHRVVHVSPHSEHFIQ